MASGKFLYVTEWIMDECDGEHQNLDPLTLDRQSLCEMIAEALSAWDGGARCYDDNGKEIE